MSKLGIVLYIDVKPGALIYVDVKTWYSTLC
jgi:hypothetical protein